MPQTLSTDKHLQVLKAAQRRFAHYGLTKVTMDEIASDLGMGKASLYYYFPTKESLFRAVVAHEQQEFLDEIQPCLEKTLPAGKKLREYSRLRVEHFRRLMNLNQVSFRSMVDMKPLYGDLLRDFAARETGLVRRLLEEGKKNHEFDIVSPDRMACLFLHVMQGLRMKAVRSAHDPVSDGKEYSELESDTREFTELFLKGISRKSRSKGKLSS